MVFSYDMITNIDLPITYTTEIVFPCIYYTFCSMVTKYYYDCQPILHQMTLQPDTFRQ